MSEHRLLCPFLKESSEFTHGVEFGMLFARMQRETKIADFFLRSNQDQILLAASRLGWSIVKMRSSGDWTWISMKKRPQRQDRDAEG
jgi:hypothetical protein